MHRKKNNILFIYIYTQFLFCFLKVQEGDLNRDENARAKELYEDMEHDGNPTSSLSPGDGHGTDEEFYVPMDCKEYETFEKKYMDMQPAERPSKDCMSLKPGMSSFPFRPFTPSVNLECG